jgi:hypothetical protein
MLKQFEDQNGNPLFDESGKPLMYESTAEESAEDDSDSRPDSKPAKVIRQRRAIHEDVHPGG